MTVPPSGSTRAMKKFLPVKLEDLLVTKPNVDSPIKCPVTYAALLSPAAMPVTASAPGPPTFFTNSTLPPTSSLAKNPSLLPDMLAIGLLSNDPLPSKFPATYEY